MDDDHHPHQLCKRIIKPWLWWWLKRKQNLIINRRDRVQKTKKKQKEKPTEPVMNYIISFCFYCCCLWDSDKDSDFDFEFVFSPLELINFEKSTKKFLLHQIIDWLAFLEKIFLFGWNFRNVRHFVETLNIEWHNIIFLFFTIIIIISLSSLVIWL